MNPQTLSEFREIIENCQQLFTKKNQDYGSAWRVLRLSSITDQIYIKAKRIRTIQEKGTQQIADDIDSEFVGIINYCVMALIQIELTSNNELDLPADLLLKLYNKHTQENETLLSQKNHDYGEAWRDMRVSSMTDLILMKLLRIKQIEDNKGLTQVSEGVEAGYRDIINYSVFCLIKSKIQ